MATGKKKKPTKNTTVQIKMPLKNSESLFFVKISSEISDSLEKKDLKKIAR